MDSRFQCLDCGDVQYGFADFKHEEIDMIFKSMPGNVIYKTMSCTYCENKAVPISINMVEIASAFNACGFVEYDF